MIDHNSIALFDVIPPEYLVAAGNLDMYWTDRSVGENINRYLDCFTAPTYWQSLATCRRYYSNKDVTPWAIGLYTRTDWESGNVSPMMYFDPDAAVYDRIRWSFEFYQGEWADIVENFITVQVPAQAPTKKVLSYQFSYLNVDDDFSILDEEDGFFADGPDPFRDIYDIERMMDEYPDKTWIFWTSSLARYAGSSVSEEFNDKMRQYAIDNDKILFDVADILSHDLNGNQCYDNRDGVNFCGSNGCENYPDDGLNYAAICADYTTEFNGGHLGSVGEGGIRVAKAYWVLMARIAGWNGQP